MYFIAPCNLKFEEDNGVLSAVLSHEAMRPMIEVVGCFPCRARGKWGLLYFTMKACEEANEKLQEAAAEFPLLKQVIRNVVHRPELDIGSRRLFLPRRAACFAEIKRNAVLTQISEGCLLLTAEEE